MRTSRVVAVLVAFCCAACSSGPGPREVGDCALDFQFRGATYVLPNADVKAPVPSRTTSIGTATTPTCDAAGSREKTAVFAYPGVSPSIAITDDQGNVGVRRGATAPSQLLRSPAPSQS